MPKLVVLTEGFTGQTYELKVEKTTIGRVDDNSFQVPEGSVSSHHCEVLLRGNDVVVKDLNSTNGTFINGQKASEAVLKPGQILRLGQVEMRLESGEGQGASGKKNLPDKTMVIPQGVKLNEMDQGTRPVNFDKNSPFAKKSNRGVKVFIALMLLLGAIIAVAVAYSIFNAK